MAPAAAFVVLSLLLSSIVVLGQERRPVVVSGVSLVDVASGHAVPGMTVVIRGDRIEAVGTAASTPAPRGAQVVDGRGGFLIPGLWDMHVHLSYARASALPALVANGVTTVRDLGSSLPELEEWRRQMAAGRLAGPRVLRAGPMLNGQEFNPFQIAVANEAEARAAVRVLHRIGADVIKLHRRTSREAYFAIADEAKRLSLPFVGHVPMTVTPAEASDAGQATLEHVETLFEGTFSAAITGRDPIQAMAEWLRSDADRLFAMFVANGTFVTPTLVAWRGLFDTIDAGGSHRLDAYMAASARKARQQVLKTTDAAALAEQRARLQQAYKVVAAMHRAGVSLLAGTDLSVVVHPGFSVHQELAELVQAGLSPVEALRTATVNPARLFPKLEAGSIAAGKRADLVLLDANPLSDIRNTQRIRAVVAGGTVYDRKALDRLLAEASRLAEQN